MFEFIRKHTRIVMFVLFLLIIPSFVLFGIDGYNRNRQDNVVVAKVDGKDITQAQWDAAHQSEVARIQQSRPNIDARFFDSPAIKYTVLEGLIRERVLAAAAEKSHLTTSDARLIRTLQQDPAIASLVGADGKLDVERYRQLAAAQNMTPEMLEARLRSDISVRQVLGGIGASGIASASQAGVTLNAYFERREIQMAQFKPADFASKVVISQADIDKYYAEHAAQYQAPEEANIEYVLLDVEAIQKSIVLNEADMKTYYEQNVASLSGSNEERRASHILITSPSTDSAADRAKAKAKAEELLAQVRKAPDSFADVAKKNSQDPGSAARGGDLDYFARGAMVPAFEKTVFAMKKGEISNVVETDFGYHIIKLVDVRGAKTLSYEEVKPKIEAALRKQEAQKKFAEIAESFTNGVYEQPDSLKPIADKLKLDIRTASKLTRTPAPGAQGPLANSKFLDAIFAPDSISQKRNTVAIETAPSQLISGRVVSYAPARTLPLDEVKDQVRKSLTDVRAAELARKEGEAKLAAWKANPQSASLPAAMTVSRDQEANKLPDNILGAVLRVDPSSLPGFTGVDLGSEGYAVVKVNKIVPTKEDATLLAHSRDQYTQGFTGAEAQAYYEMLKQRFKVQIKVPKPDVSLPAVS